MLIGVLEYAGSYIDDPAPYDRFLDILSSHLAQGGQIVVAIENKYGMKYFAGCREDHTGGYYDGIEGYPGTDEVRTFSHDELVRLAGRHDLECEFYYPYPDYKLPETVYSDKRMPQEGELENNIRNFDGERFSAFNESHAFNEAIRDNEFPMFSNSFLLLLSKESRIESFSVRHPLYSKHSNERARKFCIRTDIEEDGNGNKFVAKYPLTEEAREHLENMARSYERQCIEYSGTKLKPNVCKRINDGEGNIRKLEFEYLKGPTLDKELATCIEEGREEDGKLVIRNYADMLRNMKGMKDFEITDSFTELFGEVRVPDGQKSLDITNLDLIFSNFIVNGGWNVIDYEWTFDFPIPVDFVIYRAVFYYTRKLPASAYSGVDLFELAGISHEMRQLFAQMEHNFQMYIAGEHITLNGMYSIMGGDSITIGRAVTSARQMEKPGHVKLYFDKGRGYNEGDTLYIDADVKDDCRIIFDVQIPEDCSGLRIDPAAYRCMVKIYLIEDGIGDADRQIEVNGHVVRDNTILYDTDDPQMIIRKVLPGMKIHVEYKMQMIDEEMFEDIVSAFSITKTSGFGFKKTVEKSIYTKVKL